MKRRGLPKAMRFEVFKRDRFTCRYCGSTPPDAVLHCDHVRPVCRGGQNALENLVTACRDCNAGKGARLLDDRSKIERQLELYPDRAPSRPAYLEPDDRRLFYIQGILRNRLGDRRLDCVRRLRTWRVRGLSLDTLERAAKQARDWAEFDVIANTAGLGFLQGQGQLPQG